MKKLKFGPEDKAKLNLAFKALRKLGYIAKQNYMCCQGCAGAQIANDIGKMEESDIRKVMGVVFYHKQDTDKMNEYGEFMLRYGPVHVNFRPEPVGVDTWTCGIEVCRVLADVGLEFEWDQKPDTAILVKGSHA